MIISHKHKFIFIHIPKCAGTSVTHSLVHNLYLESPNKNEWRFNGVNKELAQIFKEHPEEGNCDQLNQHEKFYSVKQFFIENELDINEYFKFSFVRNPWSRIVSTFAYGKKMAEESDPWTDWANHLKDLDFLNFTKEYGPEIQLEWVSEQKISKNDLGEPDIGLDFIGKNETLQEDFNYICDKIGVHRQKIAHVNKNPHKHYTEHYNNETRDIISKKYAKDIEFFGYKFGE